MGRAVRARPDAVRSLIDNRSGTALGGAIATLIDIAGAAVVWAGHDFAKGGKHATVNLSITFMASARGQALIADARCIRRQREFNFVCVDVRSEVGTMVASALMTFRVVNGTNGNDRTAPHRR